MREAVVHHSIFAKACSPGEPVTGPCLMSMHLAKHQVSKITCNCWPIIRNFLHPKVFFLHPRVFFLTRKCSSQPSHSCSCSGKRCHALSNMRRMLFFFSILLLWCKWKRVVALIHYCRFIFNMVYYFFDSVCFCFQYFDLNSMSLTSKSQSD